MASNITWDDQFDCDLLIDNVILLTHVHGSAGHIALWQTLYDSIMEADRDQREVGKLASHQLHVSAQAYRQRLVHLRQAIMAHWFARENDCPSLQRREYLQVISEQGIAFEPGYVAYLRYVKVWYEQRGMPNAHTAVLVAECETRFIDEAEQRHLNIPDKQTRNMLFARTTGWPLPLLRQNSR